jgi:hypothetical protein
VRYLRLESPPTAVATLDTHFCMQTSGSHNIFGAKVAFFDMQTAANFGARLGMGTKWTLA